MISKPSARKRSPVHSRLLSRKRGDGGTYDSCQTLGSVVARILAPSIATNVLPSEVSAANPVERVCTCGVDHDHATPSRLVAILRGPESSE